jgi:hypothetical protein
MTSCYLFYNLISSRAFNAIIVQVTLGQGDQIRRIFAQWVFFYIGQFSENDKKQSAFFEVLFSTVKVTHQFRQKCIGLHFVRFYSQTHLATLHSETTLFYCAEVCNFTDRQNCENERCLVGIKKTQWARFLFKKPKDACEAILMLILRASYLK